MIVIGEVPMNAFSKQMSDKGKDTWRVVRCAAVNEVPLEQVDPERYACDYCLDCRKGILRPVIGMDNDEAMCVKCFDELMEDAAEAGIEVKVQPLTRKKPRVPTASTKFGRRNFDFQDWKDDMEAAIDDGDTEEVIRIFRMVRAERDEAEQAGDIERQQWIEGLLGQWLITLEDRGLLVEPH
jgi:hypothetical protein